VIIKSLEIRLEKYFQPIKLESLLIRLLLLGFFLGCFFFWFSADAWTAIAYRAFGFSRHASSASCATIFFAHYY